MRLTLPPPPEPATPTPFPVVGVIAPLLVAGAIWAVTRSPFALIFAALSPVIALASVLDSRLQGRRRRTRAAVDEVLALDELQNRIRHAHDADRIARSAAAPTGRSIADGTAAEVLLWRGAAGGELPIVLGCGAVPSGLTIDGVPGSDPARRLVEEAAVLDDVPVLAEARQGIGVCGIDPLAVAVLRGMVLQLAYTLSPAQASIRGRPPGNEWNWLERLPHWDAEAQVAPTAAACRVTLWVNGSPVVLAAARTSSRIPPECRTVLEIMGTTVARVLAGTCTGIDGATIRPDLISRADAAGTAEALRVTAARSFAGPGALPDSLALETLLERGGGIEPGTEHTRSGLGTVLGVDVDGAHTVDLVADGPHAVVGGTTGSGKSELLITWIGGLASRLSPTEVTFLLVDFKGGASFDGLARLPHCVGLITDLDPHQAERALESLRAELRYRERLLRDRGVRDIRDISQATATGPDAIPRLVIVVDEFAAMLVDFPELHDVFADIASRGRSLGVHLILCTQRPAGAVRDSLLANCNLRLSLRVNSRADSTAVLGTDAAASLPARPIGRCLVGAGGGAPTLIQVASLGSGPLDDLVRRCQASARLRDEVAPRRPWLDPLPAVLPLADLEDPAVDRSSVPGGVVFGLLDVPSEQSRRYATWHPGEDGHLIVLGAHRSGKTSFVSAVAAVGAEIMNVERVPADTAAAWDAVHDALARIRSSSSAAATAPFTTGGQRRVLAIDDIDAVVARFDSDYQVAFLDALTAVLREGPPRGLSVMLTAQRLSGALAPLATLTGRTALLRMANRQEHALAGGVAARFDESLPPGAGWWGGHRLQVARTTSVNLASALPPTSTLTLRPGRGYAVVSTRPGAILDRIRSAARGVPVAITDLSTGLLPAAVPTVGRAPLAVSTAEPTVDVVLGDPDEWQAQWGALAAARSSRHFVYDACGARDYRTISRSRELPPPIPNDGRTVWFSRPGGSADRRVWPSSRGG